ncbi:WD repeat-containing protein 19-like isoform X2 [Portunus trituberculatus]|uniref:WD repeat-containing protein 19-like isoform X2 n=1 Tax=Portunus trituberculatus TaxID=210409 RepID=UPI001E1CCEBB|nr:WD repeat-containing protein 19-like isoform X2 [Portunus trituberculatus]
MSSYKRVFSLESPHGPGGVFFTWQKASGGFLATTGYNQVVNIYDRHGNLREQIHLPGVCSGFGWDKDGALLSIINDRSPLVHVWDANSGRVQHLDSGLRDTLTFLSWSRTAPLLAVGTAKGNLMIYNHQTSRRIPVVGKHSRKIQSGSWSTANLLALGGEDKILTISNSEGDTLRTTPLRGEPSDIQFSEMKQDERAMSENTVSLIVAKKTLFLYNLNDPENPIELAFENRYGTIVTYKCIKIHELTNLKESYAVVTVDDERGLDWLEWSDDGQLLAVASPTGNIHVYLTKLPVLGGAHTTRVAFLTSLLEVTVTNIMEKESPVTVSVDVEPTFLGVGPYHLVVGMNNRAWIYTLGEDSAMLLRDREYLGTITSVRVNADYASVLYEGKIQFHLLEGETGEDEEREARLFPDPDHADMHITDHALTADFLVYSTDTGGLFFFFIEDWQMVGDYRHTAEITSIYAEPSGRRIVLVDSKGEGYLYNPVNDDLLEVPQFPGSCHGCLWENSPSDRHMFTLFDEKQLYTYIYHQEHIKGHHLELIGMTKFPSSQVPLLLYNGEVTLQTASGKTVPLILSSHEMEANIHDYSHEQLRTALKKNISLRRFKDASAICQVLNNKQDWEDLGKGCLWCLNLELGMRVFRQLGDVGMVWSLQSLKDLEDPLLLSGHLAMFLNEFNLAQDLYLRSSSPVAALEMRRDLLHWDQALQLAKKLSPDQIPFISREYAQQLEFIGDYPGALTHYERGVVNIGGSEDHNAACKAGIARTALRCGDIRRGVNIAAEMNSRMLKRECAEILESKKQYSEAAVLYESGNFHEKASSLYIRLKNWNKVGQLLVNINSPKMHLQYAKAKESDGQYREAATYYESARDYESVIRLLLHNLNSPEEAVRIVRETKSVEGAKMVAKFFQKLGDYNSAIQFLVLSKCMDEAFQLARTHGKMELYAEILGSDATPEDYKSVALHFENERNHFLSGKFYYLAGVYPKAVKHLIRAAQSTSTEDSESIQMAIDVVAAADDDGLTRQLIDFLMGEVDGIPKDAKYLFRLYMAKNQYREAAKTAIIIAREEQNSGNYRHAHDVLLGMYGELQRQKLKIPADMSSALLLLHSYTLARLLVRKGDHLKAARMLIRVSNNISKFPAHMVPILTSTVIECQRAGLKNSSFSFAAMLMRPETRGQIDERYKKKIEAIVRKPQKSEEEEKRSPCPFCSTAIEETSLECAQCQSSLPYCIATGQHILADDITICPSCKFPAIRTELIKLVQDGEGCPMCNTVLEVSKLTPVANWKTIILNVET